MKNWKTTVAGLIAGAIPAIDGISHALATNGTINWYSLGLGLGIMTLGVLSKDAGPAIG